MGRAGFKKKKGKCVYKTSKGNSYDDYFDAKLNADKLTMSKNVFIEPYYCEICKKFHIGKASKIYSFPRYQNYGIIQFLLGGFNL